MLATRRARRTGGFRSALLAVAMLAAGAASAAPQRIVSINLCTDQLLMLLADRARIASVSFLAADPQSSAMAAEARGITVNHGLAEEVLPMKPDLVLAGTFTTRPTVALLRRLGIPVVEVPLASRLGDVRQNVRMVAGAIGEEERGERLVRRFDQALLRAEHAASRRAGPRPLAALYWANGFTSGADTLANDAATAAGFDTLGERLGLRGTVQLPLEQLLLADADVLITAHQYEGAALAKEIFRHPALKQKYAQARRISVPDHLWSCGTPHVADAVRQLAVSPVHARAGE